MKKGLWTKAFSESEGDENKTKALYIKYRFDQINDVQPIVGEKGEIEEKKAVTNGNCLFCGKPNSNLLFLIGDNQEKFCSHKCYNKAIFSKDSGKFPEEFDGKSNDSGKISEEFGGILLFFAYALPIFFIVGPVGTFLHLGELWDNTRTSPIPIKEAVKAFSNSSLILQLCISLSFLYLLFLFYKKKRIFTLVFALTIAANWIISVILSLRLFEVAAKIAYRTSISELFWQAYTEPKVLIIFLAHLAVLLYFANSTRVEKTFTN